MCEFRVKQLEDKVADDSLIARQLFTLSRRSPHKIRKTLSSSSLYVEITRRGEMHFPWISSLASSFEPRPRARKRERDSCLSEEGLSLSISRRRGGERGRRDECRARGTSCCYLYQIRGHTGSVAEVERAYGRARARARCRAVYQKASERSGVERSRVRRRASPALGDCHFRSRDCEMDFVHSTLRL